MKTVSKELILELKVLKHDFKESTHEDSIQRIGSGLEGVDTCRQWTYGIEVSTYDIEVSTHINRDQIFKN